MSDLHIPLTEKLKSIPEIVGVRVNEEPPYEVLLSDGDYEIRRYESQTLASVTMTATDQETFKEKAFETLAKYIFGGNRDQTDLAMTAPVHISNNKGENIAMTAPVLKEESGPHEWTMSFILPAKYDLAHAPQPLNSQVHLHERPAYVVATVRYTGNNTEEKETEFKAKLKDWLAAHPEFKAEGDFASAQYDAPFVIPFLKRNEIHVNVRPA